MAIEASELQPAMKNHMPPSRKEQDTFVDARNEYELEYKKYVLLDDRQSTNSQYATKSKSSIY